MTKRWVEFLGYAASSDGKWFCHRVADYQNAHIIKHNDSSRDICLSLPASEPNRHQKCPLQRPWLSAPALAGQGKPSFSVKLAERLTAIQPDIEAYLRRPPFIQDFLLIDEDGEVLDFSVVTYPHIVYLQTRLGDFALVFQDEKRLPWACLATREPVFASMSNLSFGRRMMGAASLRQCEILVYTSNCETVRNEISPDKGGYTVEYIVQADDDSAISITIRNALYPCSPDRSRSQLPSPMQRRAGGIGSSVCRRSTKNTVLPMLTRGGSWLTT